MDSCGRLLVPSVNQPPEVANAPKFSCLLSLRKYSCLVQFQDGCALFRTAEASHAPKVHYKDC